MKSLLFLSWIILIPCLLQAQYTWDRYETPATGGQQSTSAYSATTSVQHYETKNISNSTLTGNTGFLFPETLHLDIVIDLKVLLEGPFNGTDMNTDLNNSNIIPLNQPFNTSPWNYLGEEAVSAIPNDQVIDWILIEGRDAPNAAAATEATTFEQQAAFLLKDGRIVGLDGTDIPFFSHSLIHSLFIVIKHRNHLAIMSANPIPGVAGIYSWDFSTNVNQAYQSGQKQIAGTATMIGGDLNASGSIDQSDIQLWQVETGKAAYYSTDANMDSQVNNNDKNDIWLNNNGINQSIPE